MKIQIVQVEIEEAIRDFIRKQIDVKDGMEITMDFTATRGDDGLIAAIDISPAAGSTDNAKVTAPQSSVTAATTAPAVEADAPAPRATRTFRPRAEATAATVAAGASDDVVVEETTAVEEPEAVSTAAAENDDQEDDRTEAERPLRPSIFSGLNRPSNGSAEAVAD